MLKLNAMQCAVGLGAVGAVALYRHLRRPCRLYVCGQQTEGLNAQLASFLGWRTLVQPVKAAMPPFNRRPGMVTLPTTVEFNAPVFGPAIANATMSLYDSPEMRALATELGIHIPDYRFDSFVQKKHVKVNDLVAVAKARPDCASGANAEAIRKLERFLAEFGALKTADVPDLKAWLAFCGKHAPAGWEQNLHFERILPFCFGFEPATAAALAAHQHTTVDEKTGATEAKSLQEWSLRWLSKAFGAYGPQGCLGDVVNLCLAMQHPAPPADSSEAAIVAALGRLQRSMERAAAGDASELAALWLPTHLLQDAESDDTLSWLLLERVRRLLGAGPLRVMLQLGAEEKLDQVAAHMASKGAVVWRDAGSKNGDAVLKNHAHI